MDLSKKISSVISKRNTSSVIENAISYSDCTIGDVIDIARDELAALYTESEDSLPIVGQLKFFDEDGVPYIVWLDPVAYEIDPKIL
jgi:hypothetical protein